MKKRFKLYGMSDDLLEVEFGEKSDEITAPLSKSGDSGGCIEIESKSTNEKLLVRFEYGESGTWQFTPILKDESEELPEWNISIEQEHEYSTALVLDNVPEDTTYKIIEDQHIDKTVPHPFNDEKISDKTYENTLVLSYFFGFFGVDRFYLGKIPTGLIKLFTLGGLGFFYLVDLWRVAHGYMRDKDGRILKGADEPHELIRVMATVGVLLQSLAALFLICSLLAIWLLLGGGNRIMQDGLHGAGSGETTLGEMYGGGQEEYGQTSALKETFTLTLGADGCGVIRTELPDERFDGLQWSVDDMEGFQVLGRVASNETRYRYFGSGQYTVTLKDNNTPVSNTVTINCP